MGSFNNGVDAWQGEGILDGDGIDLSVVEYRSEASVLFFDVEDRSSIRGLRFSNEAGIQLFLDVLGLEFFFGS